MTRARFPSRLGPYRLLRPIGRGASSVVFEAVDRRDERAVVLKVLRPERLDERTRSRFRREAEAARKLRAPGVVRVLSTGEQGGFEYIVFERFEGARTLDHRLKEGPLDPPEAARLAASLARTIEAAHSAGIVHRDLKPGNVLLAPDGVPRLFDFGLAREIHVRSDLTRAKTVMGSLPYLSPEQARGQSRDAGPATDIYGLGAILYHLLAGRPPFPTEGRTDLDVLSRIATEDPPPPDRFRPGLPSELVRICRRAMARDPERRYRRAAELALDLELYLFGHGPRGSVLETTKALLAAAKPRERLRRHGPWLAPVAVLLAAAALAWSGRSHRALRERELDRALERAFGAPFEVLPVEGEARAVAFDPAGRFLALGFEDGRVALLDLSAGTSVELARLDGPVESMAVDRGARRVALVSGGRACVVSEGEVTELGGAPDPAAEVAFAGNPERLAVARVSGTLEIHDPSGRGEPIRVDLGVGAVTALAPAYDGAVLAAGGAQGRLALVDAASGAVEDRLLAGGGPVVDLAGSGTVLAVATTRGPVRVWTDVARLHETRIDPPAGGARSLSLGRAGGLLAVAGASEVLLAPIPSGEGETPRRLAGFAFEKAAIRLSPEGRLASAGPAGRAILWRGRD